MRKFIRLFTYLICISILLGLFTGCRRNYFKVKARRNASLKCPNYKQKSFPSSKRIQRMVEKKTKKPHAQFITITSTLRFETIDLENKQLDIPEFKQFKNNRSEFTGEGDTQFNKILGQLKDYLGEDSNGDGATLRITGSASQIPTSYHPNKPNYGINPDGSSIRGETSVENNIFLAYDRAMTLAYKIKETYPYIDIITPELEEIKLGKTKWTMAVREELYRAIQANDKEAIAKVYEPFQKDQFVKIESQDIFIKRIKPSVLHSYAIAAIPRIVMTQDTVVESIKSSFVVSKETYHIIKHHKHFKTVEARDAFLAEKGLQIEL